MLGSFPSVKSRECGYFYGHPQNRFWKVMNALFDEEIKNEIEDKKNFLLKHKIALWDVIASCDIVGSSDSSITNVVANDISNILKESSVEKIFVNGRKSQELYKKYIEKQVGIKAEYLPSTSPANARWTVEKLLREWKTIKDFL
ncbi:DNA-deoxyinosine glycosylase [Peptostreptococcus equinus]|uniref:DNA-deoxyinosine glycosylase n=1 Tax=Peptostreptococcus equinus TaxID=3003601 RepID=A0ABY7JUU0_9FIRM|nr:DNA-deoxyinosine glycosylase [Peptostreptococcus sp. CBA3647]WAW15873.1 DNA-deoxyinosine glycosylase [Peptostreptococcus sp. CBA3647]